MPLHIFDASEVRNAEQLNQFFDAVSKARPKMRAELTKLIASENEVTEVLAEDTLSKLSAAILTVFQGIDKAADLKAQVFTLFTEQQSWRAIWQALNDLRNKLAMESIGQIGLAFKQLMPVGIEYLFYIWSDYLDSIWSLVPGIDLTKGKYFVAGADQTRVDVIIDAIVNIYSRIGGICKKFPKKAGHIIDAYREHALRHHLETVVILVSAGSYLGDHGAKPAFMDKFRSCVGMLAIIKTLPVEFILQKGLVSLCDQWITVTKDMTQQELQDMSLKTAEELLIPTPAVCDKYFIPLKEVVVSTTADLASLSKFLQKVNIPGGALLWVQINSCMFYSTTISERCSGEGNIRFIESATDILRSTCEFLSQETTAGSIIQMVQHNLKKRLSILYDLVSNTLEVLATMRQAIGYELSDYQETIDRVFVILNRRQNQVSHIYESVGGQRSKSCAASRARLSAEPPELPPIPERVRQGLGLRLRARPPELPPIPERVRRGACLSGPRK